MRCRPGLCFQVREHNIRFDDVTALLIRLHRCLQRQFILVLDWYSAQRKAVGLMQTEQPDWFEGKWLPAYAPDLNSVKLVWNCAKYTDIANSIAGDVHGLRQAIITLLETTSAQPSLIRSFFHLPPFGPDPVTVPLENLKVSRYSLYGRA